MTRRFTPSNFATAPSVDDDNLAALARRVERLTISRTNPEAFFFEKSEIAYALRRLATTTGCTGAALDRDNAGKPRMAGYGLRGKVQ